MGKTKKEIKKWNTGFEWLAAYKDDMDKLDKKPSVILARGRNERELNLKLMKIKEENMNLIEKYLGEAKKFPAGPGLDFIADQLTNDEYSSDEEMIAHLVKQTKNPRAAIAKLVKDKRTYFMNNVVQQTDARAIIRKYIKTGW